MKAVTMNREGYVLRTSIRRLARFSGLALCATLIAAAQTQDASGNGMLNGTFNFRHLAVQNVDANYNPIEVTAVSGTVTFDGAGHYTIFGATTDNTVSSGSPQPLNATGTYVIGANGTGYLTNEIYPGDFNSVIYGAVAQGVFTGSSTESQVDGNTFNDLFVAVPAPQSSLTNANFKQSYWVGLLDFTGGTGSAVKNAQFQLIPDGNGGLATIAANGQAADQGSSALTQTISGATYSFNTSSTGSLTIPLPAGVTAPNALVASGTKAVVQSADGKFVLGWTPGGYDIFFGVGTSSAPATGSSASGFFFTAAVEDTVGGFGTDSYAGATVNFGDASGDAIIHERFNAPGAYATDYGTDDQILINPTGTASPDFFGYEYLFAPGGQAFVAVGSGGFYSLQVGLHAPSFSGSGVYINPIGVINAANWQPITASLAPGELFVVFGSGLSASTLTSKGGAAFPASLGGVSVTVDGIACPIYYVSPTQIAAVAPYGLASNRTGLANIQVTNNGTQSNVVQMYLSDTAPGAFSQGADGIGVAAALHAATGQEVTTTNPAEPGEFISLYVTGLGMVTPAVSDGAVGPTSPLSSANIFNNGNLAVYFNDYATGGLTANPANVQYAGLVPTLAGLYQINVEVPSVGISNGDNVYVEFVTAGADVNEIQIPFGAQPSPTGHLRDLSVRNRLRHIRRNASVRPGRPRGGPPAAPGEP